MEDRGWIHELARAEVNPEIDSIAHLGATGPQQWIEESSVDFLTTLRGQMQEYVRAFNGFSENANRYPDVKIFNLAQGAADFMLYRSGVKLVFTNSAHGIIQIAFQKHQAQATVYTQGAATSTIDQSGLPGAEELIAQVGAFGKILWTYRGEKVKPDEVAQYFFSQFARVTRETKKLKPNQQQLLQQIRSLLQDQGLDL